MSVGLLRGTVVLEKYDPEWEIIASRTIESLKIILQDSAIDIQHIGSTSIKNMAAKPIIDIVIGVNDFEDVLKMNDELERLGFIFRGQDHPDQYLYICGKDDFITHHIHVTKYHSESWNDYLLMRDYLNTHIEDAKEYSSLKERLAKEYANDRKTYTSNKSDFINNILIKARLMKKEQI